MYVFIHFFLSFFCFPLSLERHASINKGIRKEAENSHHLPSTYKPKHKRTIQNYNCNNECVTFYLNFWQLRCLYSP